MKDINMNETFNSAAQPDTFSVTVKALYQVIEDHQKEWTRLQETIEMAQIQRDEYGVKLSRLRDALSMMEGNPCASGQLGNGGLVGNTLYAGSQRAMNAANVSR